MNLSIPVRKPPVRLLVCCGIFAVVVVLGAFVFFSDFASGATALDESVPVDMVGAIDGEAISINGPMSVEAAHGQVKTLLRSGADVRVKSGSAHIDLVEGGQVSVCGPARFSVLKSSGALTLALEEGTLHLHVETGPSITVYTPQIKAQPISIGDGPQDLVMGFDTAGAMCVLANRGAVRLEQQLNGQNVLLPQGGDVLLTDGQLDKLANNTTSHCSCELEISKTSRSNADVAEISRMATAEEIRKRSFDSIDARPNLPAPSVASSPDKEPIYQVIVPPLVYDAKSKVQPEIDPRMIVLVRKVHVRPTLIFQGRVEGSEVAAAMTAPSTTVSQPATITTTPKTENATNNTSMLDRAWNYVRKLWSGGNS